MFDVTLIAPERERPLKRGEYERLVEAGAFEGEHVELLHGRLIEMSPQGPRHVEVITRLMNWLVPELRDQAIVRVQAPFAAPGESMPEPDLAVVPLGDYSAMHPASAFLIVEVAGTSLKKDRLVKTAVYASAGVAEYWVVDLGSGTIEVLRDPRGGAYHSSTTLRAGGELRVAAFPSVSIEVSRVLR